MSTTPKWLDALVEATDAADNTLVNVLLVLVFTLFSTAFALVATLFIQLTLGWPHDTRLLVVVGAVAALTSFTASVPGVLFADVMIERLRRTREDLDVALSEAKLASRAKSEFLANMSHEIRTPLNGVLGMAQVLERTTLDAHQQALVADIRDSGALLMAIVNDVLDLSKIEAGKIEISPENAALHQAISGAVNLFSARAAEQQTRLGVTIDDAVPAQAMFDAMRVRQCVGNLVSNAVKFTPGGDVHVHVGLVKDNPGDPVVSVRVVDTGIGMDQATLGRLFNAFSQADASIERKFGGTGLGLAISRRLARLLGGDIEVASTQGAGSAFTFTFPIKPASVHDVVDQDQQKTVPTTEMTGVRVLVADDNAINRRVARLLLSHLNAEIAEAQNGVEALEQMRRQTFDFVLLDVHMPVMDGLATIRAIRSAGESWADVPVIALTADAMSGEREKLLASGMSGYVAKPISVNEFYAEIGRVLAIRHSQAA